jgi:hypothetical protein
MGTSTQKRGIVVMLMQTCITTNPYSLWNNSHLPSRLPTSQLRFCKLQPSWTNFKKTFAKPFLKFNMPPTSSNPSPPTSIPHTTLTGLIATIYSDMMIESGYQTLIISDSVSSRTSMITFLQDTLDSTRPSVSSEDSTLGQISVLLFKIIARHVLIVIMLKLPNTDCMVY